MRTYVALYSPYSLYDDWDLMTIIRSMQLSLFHCSTAIENAKCILYSISHKLGIVKLKNITCTAHSLESCPVLIEIPGKQTTVAHRGNFGGEKTGSPRPSMGLVVHMQGK